MLQPVSHLRCRLVGERDRQDLAGFERARRSLVRDPPRDRRRLAGARAGEDADRSVHGLDRSALLGIEIDEDAFCVHLRTVETA